MSRGIVVRTGQVDEMYVKVPDPTPIGGTYFDMQAASINNAGQIAFFADYHPTPYYNSVGSQELLEIGEKSSCSSILSTVDNALAWRSRNPMQTIDAAGNVVFWANLIATIQPTALCLG